VLRGVISLTGNVAPATTGIDVVSLLYSIATPRVIGGGSRSDLEDTNRAFEAQRLRPVIDRVFPYR
jgi:hypothetical protein